MNCPHIIDATPYALDTRQPAPLIQYELDIRNAANTGAWREKYIKHQFQQTRSCTSPAPGKLEFIFTRRFQLVAKISVRPLFAAKEKSA